MKKHKKLVAMLVITILLVSNTFVSKAKAVSLINASDRLSTSNVGSLANHTITFTSSVALGTGDYFLITIPGSSGFGSIATSSITCPVNSTSSSFATTTARCVATGVVAAGVQTITIANIANPITPGSQTISAFNYASTSVVREDADMVVAIISNVVMSASVPSTLTLTIAPVATNTLINNASTTGASATTSIGFGNLVAGTSSIIGQELRVTTNATYGFTVTAQQNQPLTSAGGSTIDSFATGTPPANPIAWQAPTGILAATSTYGHMGFTVDDSSLSTGNPYNVGTGGDRWMGFTGTTTKEVMYSTGPADGTTQGIGVAKVAFRVQVTGLQEAGDYTNTITYIATPTY